MSGCPHCPSPLECLGDARDWWQPQVNTSIRHARTNERRVPVSESVDRADRTDLSSVQRVGHDGGGTGHPASRQSLPRDLRADSVL